MCTDTYVRMLSGSKVFFSEYMKQVEFNRHACLLFFGPCLAKPVIAKKYEHTRSSDKEDRFFSSLAPLFAPSTSCSSV